MLIPRDYAKRAQRRWTPERVRKVTAGRKYALTPEKDPEIFLNTLRTKFVEFL